MLVCTLVVAFCDRSLSLKQAEKDVTASVKEIFSLTPARASCQGYGGQKKAQSEFNRKAWIAKGE
jgi:hypothetical protein